MNIKQQNTEKGSTSTSATQQNSKRNSSKFQTFLHTKELEQQPLQYNQQQTAINQKNKTEKGLTSTSTHAQKKKVKTSLTKIHPNSNHFATPMNQKQEIKQKEHQIAIFPAKGEIGQTCRGRQRQHRRVRGRCG